MELSRRDALVAGVSLLLLPFYGEDCVHAEEPVSPRVNERLTVMRDALLQYAEIDTVTPLLQPNATKGLVHLEWAHFRDDIRTEELPVVESNAAESYAIMARAMDDKRIALTSLLQEGVIEGRAEQIVRDRIELMRTGVRNRLTIPVPFGVSDVRPSPERLRSAFSNAEELLKPASQIFYPNSWNGRSRQLRVSPMAVGGAGIALHHMKGLRILGAEDSQIDRKAEQAEMRGNEAEYKRWVHDERNKHMLKIVREGRDDIVFLLCGYNHDFRTLAKEQGVSLLIVTPKSVAAHRAASKKGNP